MNGPTMDPVMEATAKRGPEYIQPAQLLGEEKCRCGGTLRLNSYEKRTYKCDGECGMEYCSPIGTITRLRAKAGRNSLCHCGSGKKLKKCCIH